VQYDWRGLEVVESHRKSKNSRLVLNRSHLSNGLVEFTNDRFWLRYANFGPNSVMLAKGQIVGVASQPPSIVALMEENSSKHESSDGWWEKVREYSHHLSDA
jgi:hypothetical protein